MKEENIKIKLMVRKLRLEMRKLGYKTKIVYQLGEDGCYTGLDIRFFRDQHSASM